MATNAQRLAAWNHAKPMRNKDPRLYRQDPYGNPMFRPSYGKNSPMGWEVDHIKPKSRGGSDATRNLQAINTSVNRRNGATLRKRSRHSKRNK